MNRADFSVIGSDNSLRLKGLALILLIIKLGNYPAETSASDQKQNPEISLEI